MQLGKTPWLEFVKSKALWAIIVAHFVENWGVYMMLTQLPTYVKAALDFTLEEVFMRDRLQISLLMLREFKQINNFCFPEFIRKPRGE